MTTTISIATHKGGAGKTVTAMALSAALARAGYPTLLLDLDPQGHCTLGLGVRLENHSPTLRDIFTDPPVPVASVIRETHIPSLHIIPSNIRLERMAHAIYSRPKREELLKKTLQPVAKNYRFLIADCPPSLGALTENAIAAADLVVIPCQMEARAADALVDLLELIHIIKGKGFTDWRILITRFDSRKSLTNQAIGEALAQWQDHHFKTVIPQSESINQAQIAQTDIFSFNGTSKGAQAYQTLSLEEVLPYGIK